jgi:hypothetical protein
MTADQASFLVRSAAFDDLLSSPGTILVDPNHGKVGSNAFEHGVSKVGRGPLEQLLNDSIANIVASKLVSGERSSEGNEALTSAQSSMRSTVI